MKAQTLITVISITVAVLSLLYSLVGKRDTVMTKLIEAKIETINEKMDKKVDKADLEPLATKQFVRDELDRRFPDTKDKP